jgi:transposase InsO family protein
MSWKETGPMQERLEFVRELLEGNRIMTELCLIRGVSRKTGYKWWNRYLEHGVQGLRDHSRAPLNHPNAVAAEVVSRLLEAKGVHPNWGPEKLLDSLSRTHPQLVLPVVSTAAEILRRQGLVKARRQRRRTPAYTQPFVAMSEPNAVWSVDFKGQFRTTNQSLCYPLTLSDGFSRYLIACQGLRAPTRMAVQRYMERAFRTYGLPWAMRSDNGTPFASTAVGGLSRLSVWWIKLGIRPERIAKGHPEQNGRHERLHWTLKQDTAMPPKASLRAQQAAFDRFLDEYNRERPHAALAKRTPAELYQPSSRSYPARLHEPEYPARFSVRRVCGSGEMKWRGTFIYLTQVLAGEPVALDPIDERHWRIYFGPVPLGILDGHTKRLSAIPAQPLNGDRH